LQVLFNVWAYIERLEKKVEERVNSVEGVEAILWQVPETLPTEEPAKLRAPPKSIFNAFLDSTKELCKTQQLSGKPVAIITGTNSQGGGQETTVLTGITPLVHHGMIFVPFGIRFTYSHEFGNVKEVKGGSPYGLELMHAFDHGYYFGSITKQLKEATA
ncbi:putative NAD(P)H dehydrogenase (quinone) FQR1-like 1, partial [Glycine soja]